MTALIILFSYWAIGSTVLVWLWYLRFQEVRLSHLVMITTSAWIAWPFIVMLDRCDDIVVFGRRK
jgi:hypothetical protein